MGIRVVERTDQRHRHDRVECRLHAKDSTAGFALCAAALPAAAPASPITFLDLDPLHEDQATHFLRSRGLGAIQRHPRSRTLWLPASDAPPPPRPVKSPRDRESTRAQALRPAQARVLGAAVDEEGLCGGVVVEGDEVACVGGVDRWGGLSVATTPHFRGRGLELVLLPWLLREWRERQKGRGPGRTPFCWLAPGEAEGHEALLGFVGFRPAHECLSLEGVVHQGGSDPPCA
jgi:GNAT superfamily N-acetyltransferase